jgi:hypothetical protein
VPVAPFEPILPVLIAVNDWRAISISRRCSEAKITRRCCRVSAWRSIDSWRALAHIPIIVHHLVDAKAET